MRVCVLLAAAAAVWGQQQQPARPRNQVPASAGDDVRGYNDTPQLPGQPWKVHDMDRPRPPKVKPGEPPLVEPPPADAIVLFNGKDLSQWVQIPANRAPQGAGGQTAAQPPQPQEPKWKVENGYFEIVPRTGRLVTKEKFGDCQLHVEWMVPKEAEGAGQGRGNSGIELMMRYEIQVLESHDNQTYADGQAASIYGQWPPLVNASRPQGEWNAYDIFFEAPRFEGDKVVRPAYFTVVHNGILVQNHKETLGSAVHRQVAHYTPHAAEEPLSLQDHGQLVRFRNIWIRRLKPYDQR